MAVSQTLSVTEVANSQNVSSNTSKVRILWQSTQTGDSWNGYTKTAKYWISINGGAETEYQVSYTLPKGTTKTILDTTITVTHKDNGSGTVKVRTKMDTGISAGVVEKSKEITLTTIPRASEISSATAVTLANNCSVKWTPKSASFRYKLKFALGNWSYTTGAIHPNTTSAYTYTGYAIPMDVAKQITSSKTGTMTVTLYSYSDSGATKQIGSADSATFTVTVPALNPEVDMTLSPVGSLPSDFAGLYIQGKTKVKAALRAEGQYGASINSYSVKVDGKSYGSGDGYTSGYLAKAGKVTVTGYATDSRGYEGSTPKDIEVLPYAKPQILPISSEVAFRCDQDGNPTDSGTYLKIRARRVYSKVTNGMVAYNTCEIRYRYKAVSATNWSAWVTILPGNRDGDEVETGALLGGVLSVQSTYEVQVQAIDDLGEYAETTITIPTDSVHMHRTKNGLGLGKYCEGENLLDVGWDARFHGEVMVGDQTLREFILAVISEGG